MKFKLVTLLFILSTSSLFAQLNKEKARANSSEAARLLENGQSEQSVALLEEAIKLDPENKSYTYQLGNVYYLAKNYTEAITILSAVGSLNGSSEQIFMLLANSYLKSGQREKAVAALEAGIKKFPRSGKLYFEMGELYSSENNPSRAIFYYENAVEIEPESPTNYYALAKIFLRSDEEVWGMIYGEIFINLERNSPKTEEMSKMLFDTYKSEIKFLSDNSFSLSFSKKAVSDTKTFELPFGIGVYEPLLMEAALKETSIDLASLDRIRTTFNKSYFSSRKDKIYPNVLFSYQSKIRLAGHMEAYNYWLLKNANDDGFSEWRDSNKEKWSRFSQWFDQNKLKIEDKDKFFRAD